VRLAVVILSGWVSTGCLFGLEELGGDPNPPNKDPLTGCALGCHGDDNSNAPPMALGGIADTSATGVGAHAQHVNIAPTWHRQVECGDCHVVPATVDAPGHIDGDNKAEVTFSTIAGMAAAAWNGTTCTAWCHGNTAIGGAAPTPTWTIVDGTQVQCGSCHGVPPPPPHPVGTNCATCHATMEEGSLTFRDPSSHINGVVDVTPSNAAGCTSCHGSTNSSAPPKDLSGATANTAPGVGAHQAHLAASTWHRAVNCSSCHKVPVTVDAPGHLDGDNISEVIFDTLNPAGVFTKATATCSTQYCHGNGRGNNGTISWVTPGALTCGRCHATDGTNMSGDHRKHIVGERMKCSQCHGTVVDAAMTIINANLHVNGVHEVKMANGTFNATTRQCANTGCHGTETW
jgi:predicted CxxxxCH...CXXCH cytochrome family protein